MLLTRAEEPGYRVVGRGDAREPPKLARHHITKPPNESGGEASEPKKEVESGACAREGGVCGRLSTHDHVLSAAGRAPFH